MRFNFVKFLNKNRKAFFIIGAIVIVIVLWNFYGKREGMHHAEPQADSSGNSQAEIPLSSLSDEKLSDEKLKELLDVCKRPDNMHPTKTDPVTGEVIEDTDALKQYNLDFINKALKNSSFLTQIEKTDADNRHTSPAGDRSNNPRYLIHFKNKQKTKITMEEWNDLNKKLNVGDVEYDGMAGTKAEALITELSQNCSAIYNQIGTQKILQLDTPGIDFNAKDSSGNRILTPLERISWGAAAPPT
jgi:hypothetical protein